MDNKNALVLGMLAALFLAPVGCAGDGGASDEDSSEGPATSEEPIIGGQVASMYTEAALISTGTFICSGAVIAPKVVLTAGHCVRGALRWKVTTPYAGNQSAISTRPWTQYVSQSEYVNPNSIDVGLLILDTPITLPSYPEIAAAAVPTGTKAKNVGRIKDGQASYSNLYFGRDVELQSGLIEGFRYSYVSDHVIQSGDSGGPVYTEADNEDGRKIVAVNSGAGGGTQTLARVDFVKSIIEQKIAESGGGGFAPPPPPPPVVTPTPTQPPTPTDPSACVGPREFEPNDKTAQADRLDGTRCGKLTPGDGDWFYWSANGRGLTYDIRLEAGGDAQIVMYKQSAAGWQQIRSVSPTRFNARTAGAGTYYIGVASPSRAAQSYALKIER